MTRPITYSLEDFQTFMTNMGFSYTEESGGRRLTENLKIQKSPYAFYEGIHENKQSILFMDAESFLNTVQQTEASLNVRLFV